MQLVAGGGRNSYRSHGLGCGFEPETGCVPGIVQDSMQISAEPVAYVMIASASKLADVTAFSSTLSLRANAERVAITRTGATLSAEDLFHRLTLGEFVDEFVEIADLSHQRFLNLLDADAAYDAGKQRS
jgi:hypothetical protein